MIDRIGVAPLLEDFLPRQRWFGASDRTIAKVDFSAFDVFRDEVPLLVWAIADVTFDDGGTASYQVPLGARPLDTPERFLEGKGRGVLGDVDTDAGAYLVYDALVDPELAVELLARVAPGESVNRVRPLNVEQSNTSVVFDERLILKFFRRLADGPNPDVEVTRELARVGFAHVSAPAASWREGDRDLAVLREYLVGATDGWTLAQTSLRDLYESRVEPARSGGDFAPEAARLGTVTAEMHAALAEAFGPTDGDPRAWTDDMERHLVRVGQVDVDTVGKVYAALRDVADPGPAIRVHGDYHLGQTMRTDTGWFILDFEGEPARPLAERIRPSSPLRDVAGMLRSFHYAAQIALLERGDEMDDELADLAAQWESRVADAFLDGYLDADEIEGLLPADDSSLMAVLDAFLLDKAVYEVGYELAHRPEWVEIPLAGVRRLLER